MHVPVGLTCAPVSKYPNATCRLSPLMTVCEACSWRTSCNRASPKIPAVPRALIQNTQRSFALKRPFPLPPGNTPSYPRCSFGEGVRSSRSNLPSRTCLGSVVPSINARRSGLSSHQRRRRISRGQPRSTVEDAPPRRRPSFPLRAGATPPRASLNRPRRATTCAAVVDSG